MKSAFVLKCLVIVGVFLVGGATAAQAPGITVTNIVTIVTADFLGDKLVKFAPAAQVSNIGLLAGQVKKIRLHTHELEDHVVYVVRGRATARLGDVVREVGPGELISIPRRVPHRFEQKGPEAFVILGERDCRLGPAQRHELSRIAETQRVVEHGYAPPMSET